ncbi:uncharacterized protein LOC144984637 [Oryzias latipes]
MKNFLITQVVSLKASGAHRVVGLMENFAWRTCTSACQLFCLPFQCAPCGNISCCADQTRQLEPEENKRDHSPAVQSVPPTILIVNISNSTLIDCVIGDSGPSAAAERRPLMQEPELQKHAMVKCGCSQKDQTATQSLPPPPHPPVCPALPPQEQLNISIEGSHLNHVIIGDNNHMHTEMSQALD